MRHDFFLSNEERDYYYSRLAERKNSESVGNTRFWFLFATEMRKARSVRSSDSADTC